MPAASTFNWAALGVQKMHRDTKTVGHGPSIAGMADVVGATAVTAAMGATAVAALGVGMADTAQDSYVGSKSPDLLNPEMRLDLERTALVVIDPRIDSMSPRGVAWPVCGQGGAEQKTVQNLAQLFQASKNVGITVAVSLTSEYLKGSGSG